MSRNLRPRALPRPFVVPIASGLLTAVLATLLTAGATVAATPDPADRAGARSPHGSHGPRAVTPLVFGHRGASGYRPEHTLASYELAIRMGADYIEPDLVPTQDGVLVARHENEIGGTTDVAAHPEFADRRTTKTIDGVRVTGWFTEDFTLAELQTLRAKERLPQVRPANTRYDGRFTIPTFAQVVDLVQRYRARGYDVGIAPETKHPSYFDGLGLSPEEPLLRTLRRAGLDRRSSGVVIQSFEVSNLRDLARRTRVPLVQLTSATGGPADLAAAGTTYADLLTPAGLRGVARYATWLGPEKSQVLPRDAAGATGIPSGLVDAAHDAGLKVVVYTVRDENQFMATNYRRGTDPNAAGDVFAEITDLLDAGVDGLFADMPDSAVDARDAWVASHA
ncbi:glycerophosphodiester phosphodiesterase [Nocardioides sp.]|uniref:glycerophosphodiester phosphodiesterase n=1 Tax=Nocardioides sp. TaxID=35761 RepID=UPI0035198B70